ncbi:MAG TPA: SH3 domain-containing protein [Clostridiales bacterium]|nr:SH3 domain-containing protein [Clostridiales bacterium]
MIRKLLKLSLACFAGTLFFTAAPKTAMAAYEEAVAGYVYDKDSISSSLVSSTATATTMSLTLEDIPIPGFNDIAIADVDTNLCIRSGAGEDYKIIGKLPKNGGCEVLSVTDNGWTEIIAKTASGTLKGYVKNDYLIKGAAATALAKEVGFYIATANTDGLNVRSEASTEASKIDIIAKGEELLVLDSKVVTDDDQYKVWVKVSLDSDTEEGSVGYVVRDFVDLSYELVRALSIQEIQYGSGVSQTRMDIVNKAKEYLGGRYVWGGTSLSNGVDCSGFVRAIYAKFGYYISRTSREQARGGSSISASDLRPGDLIFYGSSSYINHVAMYIGNGQVIHASNKRDGIKISNMYYRTPVKCVRYISN